MLGTVAAVQRRRDLGHGMLTTAITQLGQLVRVTPAGQNGADDFETGHAVDVAEHLRQLQVHQLQRLLHALDVLATQTYQIAALADVVPQSLRRLVGLEDAGQHAELVQPLNPLAVAAVGLGPALDLPSELRRRQDDRETRFEQRQKQHVAVSAGGFHGNGRHAAPVQPGDQLAQARRVCWELTHAVGTVRRGVDADPMTGVAGVDPGGMLVLDRRDRDLGALLGAAAVVIDDTGCPANLVGGAGARMGRLWARARWWRIPVATRHGGLHNRVKWAKASGGGVGKMASAVPTGSTAAKRRRGHQQCRPKIAPQPSRTNGPSAQALRAPTAYRASTPDARLS